MIGAASLPLADLASVLVRPAPVREVKNEVPTDEALFAQARNGDRAALEPLIGRYEKALFGLLVRLTNGDRHRAEDLFQETFLHVMRAAATFKGSRPFKPWLMAIAVNLVRDDARKRKVRGEVGLDSGSSEDEPGFPETAAAGENPGETASRRDQEAQVRASLTRLTLLEREVVLLHFFSNLTLVETAQSLCVPLGTVKSRLHAALSRLSGLLEPLR